MVNFGIQNLQEYNMANGFLSQIAAARTAGRAQGGIAGLQLYGAGQKEMRSLQDEIRQMEEQMQAEEESARKREGRRGRGRLVGGILGGLGAIATGGGSLLIGAGAGLGSAAGQELGARGLGTAKGLGSRKRRLGRIQEGLRAPGLFHSGRREDVELKRKDLNRFLRDADRQFDESIITGALEDALSGYKFGQSELGKFATSTDPEGRPLGIIRGAKAMRTADAARAGMAASGTATPGIGGKSISDMLGGKDWGWAQNVDYGLAREAWKENFPEGGMNFLDFVGGGGLDLPGQGFGQFYDAGGGR